MSYKPDCLDCDEYLAWDWMYQEWFCPICGYSELDPLDYEDDDDFYY